jgi:uncharacterized membrane protein (UPF0127 family)
MSFNTCNPSLYTKGLAALALAGWLLWPGVSPAAIEAQKVSEAGNPIALVRLNKTLVKAEVVSSPDKLCLGLGGRRQLAKGSGMLFVMPTWEIQEFCMRGMLIPIDIIWISQDRIIGFHQNRSPRDAGNFFSPAPADLVLEVPAGLVKSAGLQVGDRVERLE